MGQFVQQHRSSCARSGGGQRHGQKDHRMEEAADGGRRAVLES